MSGSNSLIYTAKRIKGDKLAKIKIRLNDECKNGHQDFAITADIYEANGKNRDGETVWRNIGGGCMHDEILEIAPEFAPFVALHLCDYLGRPMYAVENGFYHLRKGLGNTKRDDPNFGAEYAEYYRITPAQFKALDRCENELQFKIALDRLGILDQWKIDADKAIAILESLTGQTFIVDSVRSQYTPATPEELAAETERIAAGYYTPIAKAYREKEKIVAIASKMRAELDAEIALLNLEYGIKMQVLGLGGPEALKASIFYKHSKTLAFNWNSYSDIPETEAQRIIDGLALPDGVKAEIVKPKY